MTAVEFLHSEYKRIFGDVLVKPSQAIEMAEALAQAKEMEKQQIIEFAEWCLSELLDGSEPKAETMQGLLEIFKK